MYGDKIACASGLPCEVTRQLDNATGRYYYVILHIPTCAHATDYITQLRNERDENKVSLIAERARLNQLHLERESLKKQLEQERLQRVQLAKTHDDLLRQKRYHHPTYEPNKEEKHVCKQYDTDQMISTFVTKYKKPALTAAAILGAYMFRTDIMFMVIAGAAAFSYISYCRCKDPFNLMGNKK